MEKETWASELREGDWLSRISYIEVQAKTKTGYTVRNESGFVWNISGDIIANECQPSFQTGDKVEKATQTEMANLLLTETRGCAVSVTFTKKQTGERILEALAGKDTSKMTKKAALNLLVGEERVLVGYVIGTDQSGRVKMIDLELSGGHRQRLVDPRTISSLTLRGTKYEKR